MANNENLKPFKKGKDSRRNMSGRPKGSLSRSTIVKKWLEATEEAENPITQEVENLSQADILVLALMKKAREGDVAAFKELFDSAFGKIINAQEVTIKEELDIKEIDAKDLDI